MLNRSICLAVMGALAVLAVACNSLTGAASTSPTILPPGPTVSPTSTTVPSAPIGSQPVASPVAVSKVSTPSQAAAVVFASNPLFISIKPPTGLSAAGQPATYTVSQSTDSFQVSVTMGSGDCQSGCINQHTWNYTVTNEGKVTLDSEQGNEFEGTIDHGTSGPATVNVLFVAGPVCPVERNPPDPSCSPRPVAHVPVVLRDPAGNEVASATADENGVATFSVPAGAYYIEPGGMGGMMQAPTPTAFSVPAGANLKITLEFDTGIR